MNYKEIIESNIRYEEMIERQKKRIFDNISALTIESDSEFTEEYEKWLSELKIQEPELHSDFLDVSFFTEYQKTYFLKAKLYGRFVEEISCLDLAFLMMLKIYDYQKTKEWTFGLSELIGKGFNIHAMKDEALRELAFLGRLDLVQLLVESGADIHAENDHALKIAATEGHLEIVKYLVKEGADVNASLEGGSTYATALSRSAIKNRLDVFNYLLGCNADIQSGLFGAVCMKGHLEIVKILLQHKDQIDIHEDNDDALRVAFLHGHFEIFDLLLEHGADPNNIKLENPRLDVLKYINSRDMKKKLLEELHSKETTKRSKI